MFDGIPGLIGIRNPSSDLDPGPGWKRRTVAVERLIRRLPPLLSFHPATFWGYWRRGVDVFPDMTGRYGEIATKGCISLGGFSFCEVSSQFDSSHPACRPSCITSPYRRWHQRKVCKLSKHAKSQTRIRERSSKPCALQLSPSSAAEPVSWFSIKDGGGRLNGYLGLLPTVWCAVGVRYLYRL